MSNNQSNAEISQQVDSSQKIDKRTNTTRKNTDTLMTKLYCFSCNTTANNEKVRALVAKLRRECSHLLIGRDSNPINGLPIIQGFCKLSRASNIQCLRILFPEFSWESATSVDVCFYVSWARENNFEEYGRAGNYKNVGSLDNITLMPVDSIAKEFACCIEDFGPRMGYNLFSYKYPTLTYYMPTLFYEWSANQSSIRRSKIVVDWFLTPKNNPNILKNTVATNSLNAYLKPTNTRLFVGYMLDKTCLIDRIEDSKNITTLDLVSWFSIQKTRIEVKPDITVPMLVDHFIIISSILPEEFFKDDPLKDTILRCINRCFRIHQSSSPILDANEQNT